MKKLLQLLNEYQTQRGSKFKFSSYDINSSAFIIEKNPRMVLGEETIISKKFWFIQWLVQNNKTKEVAYWLWYTSYSERENLIRLLSIQDDPISFLVSILK